jgi:hypothetical protein
MKKMHLDIYVMLDDVVWRSRTTEKEMRGRGNVPLPEV